MRTPTIAMSVILSGSLLAGLAGLAGVHAQEPGQPSTGQEKQNIAVVRDFWRDVWEGHDGKAVPKYLVEGYIEHNNGATNGRATMERVFGRARPAGIPQLKIVSQTIYARGPFVLLLQNRVGPDPTQPGKTRTINMIEMVEVYDGLMQEHWMLYPEGHTPANQPQTDQEEKNIAVIKGFWREIQEGRNGKAVPRYVAAGFVEHDNGATNGQAAVQRALERPRPAGTAAAPVVSQTIYARGPFVLLLQDRLVPDAPQPGKTRKSSMIEMYQVYDGLVQQHWMLLPQGGMWPSEEEALQR